MPPARPLLVLVADDHPDTAESLALLADAWGHETLVAHDGPAALAAALARPPDVIFLDIGLPGLDGYEVARRIPPGCGPGLLLVALTGYASQEHQQRSREAGFDLHLLKPADPEQLRALLGAAASAVQAGHPAAVGT